MLNYLIKRKMKGSAKAGVIIGIVLILLIIFLGAFSLGFGIARYNQLQSQIDEISTSGVEGGIQSINNVLPNPTTKNIDIVGSTNILVTNVASNTLEVATKDAMVISSLNVTDATFLGTNTTCLQPMDSSCVDISGQQCMTPVMQNCIPSNLTLDNLVVNSLTVLSTASLPSFDIGNQTNIFVDNLYVGDSTTLNGQLICAMGGSVNNNCINLNGYSCDNGPLAESCVPASMVFSNVDVTNTLTVNSVTCTGGALPGTCIPPANIETRDEGNLLSSSTTTLNFAGAGVTAVATSPTVTTVNIPGGTCAIDQNRFHALITGDGTTFASGAGITGSPGTVEAIGVSVSGSVVTIGNNGRIYMIYLHFTATPGQIVQLWIAGAAYQSLTVPASGIAEGVFHWFLPYTFSTAFQVRAGSTGLTLTNTGQITNWWGIKRIN